MPKFRFALLASSLALCSCQTIPVEPLGEFKPTQQRAILAADAEMELLWSGGAFTEGPTLDKDGAVLFTDIPNNLILRYSPKTGKTTVWRENSGSANGLKSTSDGSLLV
ncbi:MAG: hypothetical protein AAF492_33040, partial [Verrucomicrobiota bacterium]